MRREDQRAGPSRPDQDQVDLVSDGDRGSAAEGHGHRAAADRHGGRTAGIRGPGVEGRLERRPAAGRREAPDRDADDGRAGQVLEHRQPGGGASRVSPSWRRPACSMRSTPMPRRRGLALAAPTRTRPDDPPPHLIGPQHASTAAGGRVATGDLWMISYPLMTTLTPVIEVADSAGANEAAKLVPDDGVVPVASPSDALAAVDRVIL